MGLWQDLDQRLAPLAAQWGGWLYAALFVAVLLQTGCILGPVLPGNPLLLAVGVLTSKADGAWPLGVAIGLLAVAAWLGNLLNYALGRTCGSRWLARSRWADSPKLERAHAFLERYGVWAVGPAVFVPFVRSWLPFLAGLGAMRFVPFALASGMASVLWIGVGVGAGYGLGELATVNTGLAIGVLLATAIAVIAVRARAKRRPHPADA